MSATLQDSGYRYIECAGRFGWVHPAEAPALLASGGVDTTDMTDEEFEAHVRAVEAKQ